MTTSRLIRAGLAIAACALLVPLAASAGASDGARKGTNRSDAAKRTVFATDSAGNLLRFRAAAPEAARSRAITGVPAGVVRRGSTSGRPPATCTGSGATRSSTA